MVTLRRPVAEGGPVGSGEGEVAGSAGQGPPAFMDQGVMVAAHENELVEVGGFNSSTWAVIVDTCSMPPVGSIVPPGSVSNVRSSMSPTYKTPVTIPRGCESLTQLSR